MQKQGFKPVPLTPAQRRMWEDTLAACSYIGPGFVHVIYTMLLNSSDDEVALFTDDISTAAGTDGYQLIFKPDRFFKYTLMERVFIVFHEVMHEILAHCVASYAFMLKGQIVLAGKALPFDQMFANIVQDLGINATLIAAKMGAFNKEWLFREGAGDEMKEWVGLYFEMWKDQPKGHMPPPSHGGQGDQKGKGGKNSPKNPPPNSPGAGNAPGRFDEHLEPHQSRGIDPHEAPERNQQAWEQAVNTAMEIQRAHGKLPGALEHFFKEVLKPKVEWTDHMRGEIVRLSGSGAYNWRKLDRRLVVRGIGAPSITGHTCGLVDIGIDTSGSIFQDKTLLARFIGETAGILEDVNPEKVRLMWCDTTIKRVDIIHDMDDLRRVIAVVPGGGGTDFRPVFDYISDNDERPDVLVYLTDMYGSFPKHEPDYPVIWASISGEKAPWGKLVRVPVHTE